MRKLLLALAFLPILSATAAAQNYAVSIVNQTPDTITYGVSFGPNSLPPVTLFPGGVETHTETNSAYAPVITFTPLVGNPFTVSEGLQAYPQPGAKLYAFRANPSDRRIFLVPLN